MQLLGIWVRERIEQMDLRKVKKLIELAEESDLAEIEVSGSDESVRIVRNRTRVESQPDLMQSISAEIDCIKSGCDSTRVRFLTMRTDSSEPETSISARSDSSANSINFLTFLKSICSILSLTQIPRSCMQGKGVALRSKPSNHPQRNIT